MTTLCTECPHCNEEIEIKFGDTILIGEEGNAICPSCKEVFAYEIRVLTTVSASRG